MCEKVVPAFARSKRLRAVRLGGRNGKRLREIGDRALATHYTRFRLAGRIWMQRMEAGRASSTSIEIKCWFGTAACQAESGTAELLISIINNNEHLPNYESKLLKIISDSERAAKSLKFGNKLATKVETSEETS